jgi:small-conductance mechanosensitive channel
MLTADGDAYLRMVGPPGILVLLPVLVYVVVTAVFMVVGQLADKAYAGSGALIKAFVVRPLRFLSMMAALAMVLPAMGWSPEAVGVLRHGLALGMIGVCAWLLINLSLAGRHLVVERYDMAVADNLRARTMLTQVNVLLRVVWVIIAVLAVACMLITFERIRQLGISLLASAGLIGIVAGFAAQRSLATMVAGLQLAITQPIRIDDVVIIEGEWGRIEEITLTYVVVRIWDERRLIVPITHFLERPFQNWTRTSAQILGTVFLWTDYTVPIDGLRAELQRIAQNSPLWDGRVCLLQVTEAGDRAMQLRALVSAADSGKCWDLRCEVREKLLDYVQRQYPEVLPRLRASLDAPGKGKSKHI